MHAFRPSKKSAGMSGDIFGRPKTSSEAPGGLEGRLNIPPETPARRPDVQKTPPDHPASLDGQQAITTFIFEVNNVPAALYKALGCFATNGVNMTKLESYQKGASFAATMFFADIVGSPGQPGVDRALEELAFHTKEVRKLGTYPQSRARG